MQKPVIKFYFQKYKKGTYWSHSSKKTFPSDDIGNQVWLADGVPCKGECLTLEEILPKLSKTTKKSERDLIMRFEVDEFPIAETTDFSKWDGIIFVDIDAQHSKSLRSLPIEAQKNYMFDIQNQLEMDCIDTFYYIEHSSSGVGMHIMFYYECPRTKEYFLKAAEYTKDILFNMKYRDFGKVIQEIDDRPGEQLNKKTFDEVYKKPFQKCYLTGIDGSINEYCTGNINIAELDKYEIKYTATTLADLPADGYEYTVKKIDVASHMTTRDWGERRSDIYAVKLLEPNQDKAYKLIEHIAQFYIHERNDGRLVNEMKNMYNSLDVKYADLDRLKRFGIYINKDVKHIHLSDNQYLGDILDKLLEESPIGVSLWQAPTGSGKNTCWINYNNRILATERDKHKPILIVEPLNSINMTKYEKDENIEVFIKSKRFPDKIEGYKMCATNYNKLLRKDADGNWVVREDAEQFLSQFELIVIDESHILTKDNFRSDIIVKFINTVKQVSNSVKIILQTATPMAEKELFDLVQRHFIITKKSNKTINLNFLRYDNRNGGNFSITDLILKVKQNAEKGILTYIYYNNAALNTLKKFRELYGKPDKTAIFHKENEDDISMQRIKEYHVMDSKNYKGDDMIDEYKYDVLLSSVYFGVGNDLNDEQDACVIIVGNNTWQEDIQAIGRFRNSKHIDVSIILRTFEYNLFYSNKGYMPKIEQEIEDKYRSNKELFKDRTIRELSIIINKKTWHMTSEEDVRPVSVMQAYDKYCSLYEVKIKNLSDPYYGINVDPDFEQFLDAEEVDETKLEEFNDKCKSVIKKEKINMLHEIYNYDIINKYPTLIEFKKFARQLINNGIVRKFGENFCVDAKNQKMLKCFCKYFRNLKGRALDYPELLALLFFYEQDNTSEYQKGISYKLTKRRYNSITAYIMFETLQNKNVDKLPGRMLSTSYYTDFYAECKLFEAMPDEMIDMFYSTNSVKENVTLDNAAIIKFFDESGQNVDLDLNDIRIHSPRDIMKQCKHNKAYESENNAQFDRIVRYCLNICNAAKIENGAKGGKSGVKPVIVLKDINKYKLKVGDSFESVKELCDKIGITMPTAKRWKDSGKISY